MKGKKVYIEGKKVYIECKKIYWNCDKEAHVISLPAGQTCLDNPSCLTNVLTNVVQACCETKAADLRDPHWL